MILKSFFLNPQFQMSP